VAVCPSAHHHRRPEEQERLEHLTSPASASKGAVAVTVEPSPGQAGAEASVGK
jgi:hypothetical protein